MKFVKLLGLFLLLAPACGKSSDKQKIDPEPVVHEAHLSDGWYPQQVDRLTKDLDMYLVRAQQNFPVFVDSTAVRALVVPHAGYYYSGVCAAAAYQALLDGNKKNEHIKRVIILSPSHTVFYKGIALPDYTEYHTVQGTIAVDTEAIRLLKKSYLCKEFADAHKTEHAIEMQLPLLQRTIADFKIVPLVVGHLSLPEDPLEAVLAFSKIIDDQTLVVVSSDFVHYGTQFEYTPFDTNILANIRLVDSFAVHALGQPSLSRFNEALQQTNATICGQEPLRVLLALLGAGVLGRVDSRVSCYYTSAQLVQARAAGFDASRLTADVADANARSGVSYVGMIFTKRPAIGTEPLELLLSAYEKKSLVTLARRTLINAFKPQTERLPDELLFPLVTAGLSQPAGAFVTLNTKDGALRGCIGRIVTHEPLYKTVQEMSRAAAFNDGRFSPLTKAELDDVVIDVSVLTPPVPVASYKDIVIGKHGVILNKLDDAGGLVATSVFLPQVARDNHWTVEQTLEQLSLKAHLARDAWKRDCRFEVFEGFEIKE